MKKETFEWIHSWCDYAPNNDLPRVLLVGDSITYGYERFVRERLKGIAYVDFVSTSYAVDTKMYTKLVKNFAADSRYQVIHFNHGLHGIHMSKKCYEKKVESLVKELAKSSKIILTTSTFVYEAGNEKPDKAWGKRVAERNEVVFALAQKYNFPVDDLYSESVKMPKERRYEDGIHYTQEGYDAFSEKVATVIKENL